MSQKEEVNDKEPKEPDYNDEVIESEEEQEKDIGELSNVNQVF